MIVFKFLKQLKKKLRSKRRWLALGALFLFLAACLVAYKAVRPSTDVSVPIRVETLSAIVPKVDTKDLKQQQEMLLETMKGSKDKQETFVQKVYVCGEDLQKLGALRADQIMQIHKEHPDWTISLNAEKQVIFMERLDDLSPECKQKAYFGLDENGNLSLFNGMPGKENVIRTFFQLNIHSLESSLPKETVKQLYEGIRVSDLAEYNSVLSTFSDYAVEETERAMFPQTVLPK